MTGQQTADRRHYVRLQQGLIQDPSSQTSHETPSLWSEGYTLKWIESFLANRSQKVVEDGESSKPVPVTSVVPQGTLFGSPLILVYINDLPQHPGSLQMTACYIG